MAGYLFVHFIGEEKDGEQVYFSLSRDGLFWNDLNQGLPVLYSHVGELGVRDPFLVRAPHGGKYYLIATDMCMYTRKDWNSAVMEGSRNILVWESDDLVEWYGERVCTVGLPKAGCVWAPEAVYDEKEEAFFVFWASHVKEDGDTSEGKHRIYASYTKDFRTFTPPEKYIERECNIIDTTIIKEKDKYYRFSKDETTKVIALDCGTELAGLDYVPIRSEVLEQLKGLEGPECYPLLDGRWCLIADQFAAGKGYLPIIIDDLETGRMHVAEEGEYDMGKTKKRHGGVVVITDEEYDALLRAF